MTSDKQTAANRRNAQKSTGPRSQEGKDAVRHNALKHGLLSQDTVLPNEDADAFKELDESLRAELRPVGAMEGLLVDRIVAAYWRLLRIGRVEAGIFAWEYYSEMAERARQEAKNYKMETEVVFLAEVLELPGTADQDEQQEALSRKAQEMKARQQEEESATLGLTFIRDAEKANAFSKLSRYETAIDRSLYKALHELQRLQAARGEGPVPPPAIDVDASGVS